MDIANFRRDLSGFSDVKINAMQNHFDDLMRGGLEMSPERIFDVLYVYNAIKSVIKTGSRSSIRMDFGTDGRDIASILINTPIAEINNTESFVDYVKVSDEMEIIAKTNKSLDIILTFYDMKRQRRG